MKRILLLLTIAFTCLSLFSTVAEARRLGGSNSFGKQRSLPTNDASKAPASAPTTSAQAGIRWLGPLAGLALGAGLTSLLAGSGLNGALATLLLAMLAAGAVALVLARLKKPQPAPLLQASQHTPAASTLQAPGNYSASVIALAVASGKVPANFPLESFLRNGKNTFIRLQEANDRMDLNDIREYTTPEMFAEISLQIHERGDALQRTDILSLHVELLEVLNQGDYTIASVRFTGQLRENKGAVASVDEVWHVQKDLRDSHATWLLAGIQQITIH
jgi:predicted lipid-binding transport protein (Tim44 family)